MPADQRTPLITSRRMPAFSQAEWASNPLKLKDRPPSARSKVHATMSPFPPSGEPKWTFPDQTSGVMPVIPSEN